MSLFAKLGTIGFAGASIGLPIPFVLRIGCGDPSTSKIWTRWVTGFPSLYCSGSKSNIYVSLAFKSDVGEKPTEGENKDLYLKGQDYYSDRSINFEEMIVGEGHQTGAGRTRGEKAWKLTIYKSGTTKFGQIGGGDGIHYADDDIKCDSKPFEVTQWTYGNGDSEHDSWEKAVNSVKFKLTNCEKTGGRRKCDIEIADSVGLKWGTTVKPKAIFCASH